MKLIELEDAIKQIGDAIYFNSGAIEKCSSHVKFHHQEGNLTEYIDARQEIDRLTRRELNLMKEKQLLIREKGLLLELMCKNITEDNRCNKTEEFISALGKIYHSLYF